MAAASLGNIVVTGLFFAILLWLYSVSLAKILPAQAIVWVLMVCFVLSMIGTVLVYRKVLATLRKDGKLDRWLGFKPGR